MVAPFSNAAPQVATGASELLLAADRVGLRLRLSQAQLAERIGAANKAVVYQWESRKRQPSPVFWIRIESLERDCA